MPTIKPNPAGSLEELRKLGLDPALVGSCAPRDGSKVLGCPVYERCVFGRKGPQNYGVRFLLEDGSSNEIELPCFDAMRWELSFNRLEGSKDIMEIVTDTKHPKGGPGTRIMSKGSKAENFTEDGKTYTKWVKTVFPRVVKEFPKPDANLELVGEAYAAGTRERMIKQRREKMIADRIGITEDDLALPEPPEEPDGK